MGSLAQWAADLFGGLPPPDLAPAPPQKAPPILAEPAAGVVPAAKPNAWGLTPEDKAEGLRRLAERPAAEAPEWWTLPYGPERGAAFAAARLAPGACRCCAGRRWWCEAADPGGWRCATCRVPLHLPEGERREVQT